MKTMHLLTKAIEPVAQTHEAPATVDAGYVPLPTDRPATQDGGVVWLTGLPGAGKSTLAYAVSGMLTSHGMRSAVLDGDVLRRRLNRDLGFTTEDRYENVRRVAEVAALFANEGLIVIVAVISPLALMRARARAIIGERFREVYVKARIETCEARDPKGMYRQARLGDRRDFTGVSAPFEVPLNADWIVDTETQTVGQCIAQLVNDVERQFVASWDTRERGERRGVHKTDVI
jgi:adenylylsulfate kinase